MDVWWADGILEKKEEKRRFQWSCGMNANSVFPGLKRARQPFLKSRTFLFSADHANPIVCASLVADRQEGRYQRGSCRCNSGTLSESDTSSILCIFLALAQHA